MNTQVRDFKSQPKREKEIEKLPITEKKARLQKIQIKKNNIYNSSPVKIIKHISKKTTMENSTVINHIDIKNKVNEIRNTQGQVFAELLQSVTATTHLFQCLDQAIYRPISENIEYTYNPLIDENGQRKITTTIKEN